MSKCGTASARILQWRRFVDTIFIRILFRFENFPLGKKTFINIVDYDDAGAVAFRLRRGTVLFGIQIALCQLMEGLQDEEQRIRWDFLYGDGAAKRLDAILAQGLVRWLKRKDRKVSGPVASSPTSADRQPAEIDAGRLSE